ncbi:MAG: membrane dipeptidase [Gemmatimonadaceae bacterium]|nr:membrane dipeptidase [Gemmatimonadaceae bacterium]
MTHELTRRAFARQAALGALAAPLLPRVTLAEAPSVPPSAWPGYERAMVIDMLATPGPFNVPDMYARPLTPAMVENVRRSGITAVNSTISGGGRAEEAFEQTIESMAAWHHEFVAHPDLFLQVRHVADLHQAKAERKLGVILGFQDTTAYGDRLARVETFHRLGVRIVQLTYNGPNLVADGCLVPKDAGLKPFGREIISQLNARGTLIDLSHTGWESTKQAIEASRAPVAVTHSGAAALNDVPRNKPDALLRQLAARGGVVGVYMMPFLRARGQPTGEDFLRHLGHCINVCGEDHVGIGTDLSISPLDLNPEFRALHAGFVKQRRAAGISAPGEAEDVFNYVPEFNQPRRLELVADAMAKAGHGSARIAKVIGNNWLRLLGEVWT